MYICLFVDKSQELAYKSSYKGVQVQGNSIKAVIKNIEKSKYINLFLFINKV